MNIPIAIPRASLTPAGRALAGLLIAASALADVALQKAVGDREGTSGAAIFFLVLVTSQATAVAIWTALGAGSTARRLAVGISAVAGLCWLTIGANRAAGSGPLCWPLLVLVLTGEVLAMFAAGRSVGLRLTLIEPEGALTPVLSQRERKEERPPLQFSLADMCLVIAAIGVLSAVLREALATTARIGPSIHTGTLPTPADLSLVLTLSMLILLPALGLVPVTVWLTLKRVQDELLNTILALVTVPAVLLFATAVPLVQSGALLLVAAAVLYVALLAGYLTVLRLCGFRLVRQPRERLARYP